MYVLLGKQKAKFVYIPWMKGGYIIFGFFRMPISIIYIILKRGYTLFNRMYVVKAYLLEIELLRMIWNGTNGLEGMNAADHILSAA